MANVIKIKRSAVAGKSPTTSDLDLGELAINTFDGKLFTKKSVSGVESIVELSGGASNNYTASTTAPSSPVQGDFWLDLDTGIQYTWIYDGNSYAWVETGGPGFSSPIISENEQTIQSDYTIATGRNGSSVGPVTISSGSTVTVSENSIWMILQ
jgi:hypothetical protein